MNEKSFADFQSSFQGFPGGSMVKNPPASAGDLGSIPMSGRSLRRKWQLTQVFLPGKSHAQRSLVGYCPWDCKESTPLRNETTQSKISCRVCGGCCNCGWIGNSYLLSVVRGYYLNCTSISDSLILLNKVWPGLGVQPPLSYAVLLFLCC